MQDGIRRKKSNDDKDPVTDLDSSPVVVSIRCVTQLEKVACYSWIP